MAEWQIVILTSVLSVGSAILSAYVTSALSSKRETKKAIHEKRTQIYLDFYEQIDGITTDRELIFSDEYVQRLIEFKPKMKLISSKQTSQKYKEYFLFVYKMQKDYIQYCNKHDPQFDLSRREIEIDENGEQYESWRIFDEDISYFEQLKRSYRSENKPTSKMLDQYLVPLYETMREDLGSNI